MEEKKFKFDPFKFMRDRANGLPVSELDTINFSNFVPCNVVSLHRKYANHALYLNSMAFSRLSKEHQCRIYEAFNGADLPYKEYIMSSNKKHSDVAKKLSILFNISVREAEEMIDLKTINVDKSLRLYHEIYEPESLITKTGNLKKENQ